jgi:septal ring factor EnvC (AmiA/AmiB activator)
MMADKYTKKVEAAPVDPEPNADAWKQTVVEKEHQPAKQKSMVTYAQLESQKASQEAQKSACDDRIAEIDAEMAKVKAAVEA